VKDTSAGEIVCLLDAIDECEDNGRSRLAEALCRLYTTKTNFNLKFLRGFQPLDIPELPTIHLSGESDVEMKKISREIDVFIKSRLHDIGARLKLKGDQQELLLQQFMRVPNRTYLWFTLPWT
jgi:ankyrin repeat domain-containing protein 50